MGNRMPCPSRDRGTFWMPRRVPEETAAYSMGWMPASSISLKTPCSGWHVPLLAFAASSISSLPHKGGAADVYGADQCGEASRPRPTRSAHPPWTPLRDLWRCRRYAMALLMPKSSPAVALRLGAICVVVAKLLEEVALNAKAVRSSRGHRHTFACFLLAHSVLALPNMSSAHASSSSFQLAASDGLSPCFAATGESVSCSFSTSSATFILNCGL